MPRHLAFAGALGLLLVSGVVHGVWSERWHTSAALAEALASVERVPRTLGEWQVEDVEADARAFKKAGAQAYWMRLYRNTRTRQGVLAILMCGRAGQMAVHTPEVCYQGAGFELRDAPVAAPLRAEGGDELGTFFSARFTKATGAGADLRLYWAWNPGDGWQAPRNARWEFRGRPFLYKLYVSQDVVPGTEDGAAVLLRQLLPELKSALVERS